MMGAWQRMNRTYDLRNTVGMLKIVVFKLKILFVIFMTLVPVMKAPVENDI